MINKKVEDAINMQINAEFFSAYLYLSMSAYCEAINLVGFATWLRRQYEEETQHALRLYTFLNDRDGSVNLHAIDQPPSDFRSPLELFEEVLSHEQKVTRLIHKLYEVAVSENDYATQVEVQWFITEQVEEEKKAGEIVESLKMIGDAKTALLLIDRELGSLPAADTPSE